MGPYELHDFFLYYAIRWGFGPRKVLRLAEQAFAGKYDRPVLLKWLRSFYRRFFSQQFKRSCLADGPKVGSVALSPRGDWRMPSDAVRGLVAGGAGGSGLSRYAFPPVAIPGPPQNRRFCGERRRKGAGGVFAGGGNGEKRTLSRHGGCPATRWRHCGRRSWRAWTERRTLPTGGSTKTKCLWKTDVLIQFLKRRKNWRRLMPSPVFQ